ncbi:hypothetical protein [Streptomyces wuyuanensis]|uniref:Mce-associated membrane protein n=1 Tax=Streptomyces wuyuanensis TaxID=1196353 RepID=A0A1G9N729_9ACTN|nr:hypothetical protein [Streptomyces wuyuanensis]SDL82183.1 Mce-associated membrane protein [Streptomyces wuyuanensis]
MANTTTRGRGAGSPARRYLTAAARAAGKRAEQARQTGDGGRAAPGADGSVQPAAGPGGVVSGRTLRAEDPPPEGTEPDWEAPDWEAPDQKEPGPEEPEPDAELRAGVPAERGDRPEGRRSPRRRMAVCAVLAVLTLAGLVVAAVLGTAYADGRRAGEGRAGALAAARKAAPAVLSYDHRHLDRDFAVARGHLTGPFLEEYRRTTTKVVAPTAKKYQGVVTASVVTPPGGGSPAASVVSASPDRAVVLLFVNQVTRSTRVDGPRVDLNRVRMELTRTSGGWKVSAVDAL